MFQRLIDDVRIATGAAARQSFFVAAAAGSLFFTTCFLCAAAFIVVLERFGLVQACLAGAAIFFAVTLVSAGCYLALKRAASRSIVKKAKPASGYFTPDPMMLAAGLQLARAVGLKKLVPVLAIAGLAFGIIAARHQNAEDQNDDADET